MLARARITHTDAVQALNGMPVNAVRGWSKNFDDLANRARADWPDTATRVYGAAAADFAAEVSERAELGAALAAARKARSLTQPALSEISGVQQAEIRRIERGVGNPTAATLLRLADALGHKLALIPV